MKKLKFFALIVVFVLTICSFSFAVETGTIPKYFASADHGTFSTQRIMNVIFSILTYVGYILAVILVAYTGIGFLIATPATKAKLKEKLWLILLGVVLLVAGIPLLNIVLNILIEFEKGL